MKKKIALFHPWLKSRGGAERVVLEIAKNFDVDIYTWVYDESNTFDEFKNFDINTIAPKFAEKISRYHLLRGLFLFLSFFGKIPLDKYDKFLISTSGIGEFILFRNYKRDKTYAYIHTPLRDADNKIIKWNLNNRYCKYSLRKICYLLSVGVYRIFEKIAWRRINHVIFNSEISKDRAISRGILDDKNSYVIHPPINLPKMNSDKKAENYFLYVSRINLPKRQLELVKAFKSISKDYPNFKLILVGNIDNKEYFNKIKKECAGENIEIRHNISNNELDLLYSHCKAGIFLGYQEDFGIVPIEVISRGKPLIAPDEGGYVSLIKDNPLFFEIKEKDDNKEMVVEIENTLRKFLENKNPIRIKEIKLEKFSKKIGEILDE